MSPIEKKANWRDLPTLHFKREAAPTQAVKQARKDVAYNVRSAETFASEFSNRQSDLLKE